jgi:hypothetical protein
VRSHAERGNEEGDPGAGVAWRRPSIATGLPGEVIAVVPFIVPKSPFTKETKMADARIYARFVDPKGTYFGKSEYRPSEGWIDVLSFNWGPQNRQEVSVEISGTEPMVVQLHRDHPDVEPVDYVVVETRNGAKWIRIVMNGVRIEDFSFNGTGGRHPTCSIRFSYKKRDLSYGG